MHVYLTFSTDYFDCCILKTKNKVVPIEKGNSRIYVFYAIFSCFNIIILGTAVSIQQEKLLV